MHAFRVPVPFLLVLAIGLGLAAAPAGACEKAGQPFVLVVDRTTRLGEVTSYRIGETTTYTVHCAPPNSPIFWSSTLNGVSTGEVDAFYGHFTDASGHWSATTSSVWLPPNRGTWVKSAKINGQSVSVQFTVTGLLTVNNSIDGGPLYTVGQSITYSISSAPPNSPIHWSSTLNGVSTGEVNAFYGHFTDANGLWTATAGPWQSQHVGSWTKTAVVGSQPAVTVGFQVIPSTEPVPPFGGTTLFNDFSNRAGIYHWTARSLLDDGANKLASIGGHALHLLFSVNCSPQQSLVDLLQSSEIQEALGNPNLKTFMLTAFDRRVCAAGNTKSFVDPTLYDQAGVYDSVVGDYRELTKRLYQLYTGTGRKFIISNWEGDNVIYCSASYAYATDAAYRAACDANYSIFYRGVPNPATALNGFKRWLQARRQGIQEGRSWAVANGVSGGMDVSFAIEFNMVNALKQPACTVDFSTCTPVLQCSPYPTACPGGVGYPSVLCDVIPQVGFDYVSYSAYESTNVSPAQLTADLNRIRDHLGSPNVIIGEFGFNQVGACSTPQTVRQRTHNIFQAALGWGVPYIFQWVMVDSDQYGVFNDAWSPKAMACYYQNRNAGFGYPFGTCN